MRLLPPMLPLLGSRESTCRMYWKLIPSELAYPISPVRTLTSCTPATPGSGIHVIVLLLIDCMSHDWLPIVTVTLAELSGKLDPLIVIGLPS